MVVVVVIAVVVDVVATAAEVMAATADGDSRRPCAPVAASS